MQLFPQFDPTKPYYPYVTLFLDKGLYSDEITEASEAALRMLLITCYEVSVQHYDQKDPLWRFFRYVRNAAAHDGRFYLQKRDGKLPITTENPSTWGIKQIHMFMDGDPLFVNDGEVEAFLKPADVLQLLHDVEATF